MALKACVSIACSICLDPLSGFAINLCIDMLINWAFARYFRV